MTTTQGRKFRETLWFAKGQKDAEAADEGRDDPFHPQAVDLLPVEDRYLDDGNVRPSLSAIFSIRTGNTEHLEKLQGPVELDASVPERLLVQELKGGRRRVIAALGGAAVVLGVVLALFTF